MWVLTGMKMKVIQREHEGVKTSHCVCNLRWWKGHCKELSPLIEETARRNAKRKSKQVESVWYKGPTPPCGNERVTVCVKGMCLFKINK